VNLDIYVADATSGGWPERPTYHAERLPVPRAGDHLGLPGDDRAIATVVAVDWLFTGPVPLVNVLAYYDPGFTPAPVTHSITDQDIREILSALEDAADYRRDQGEYCPGCADLPGGQKCGDHTTDDAIAGMYELLHQTLAGKLGEDAAAGEPGDGDD
jgi:hypothetical protein